ncbi:DUF4349 domain-containing protein [Streptomyces sp. NPDC048650]|uniref:DUF4349 domain-containing protein n=1 Tax=Streptomyces sp. NPDC048650 TaxID=3365583 RepID=UPI0037117A7C
MLLAVSPAVAGCSADGAVSSASDRSAGKEAAAPSRAPGGGQGGSGATATARGADGRAARSVPDQIIRTATLTVQTKDVPAALARARGLVDGAGGYAADESSDRDSGGHDRSRIVLRVPPKEYDAVLTRLAGLGRLVSRQVSAKDVTDRVVDTDSRIKSQRASVSRVRALMDKATSISDIVSLESELSSRQASLESLEAELKSLRERSGTATVTLLLRQPDAVADKPAQDGPTTFSDALSGGWHAFVTAVRWVLVAIGALLPFAVTAGLLYGLWRVLRGRLPVSPRARRRTGGDTAPEAARAAGDGPAEGSSAGAPQAPRPAPQAEPAAEGDRGTR